MFKLILNILILLFGYTLFLGISKAEEMQHIYRSAYFLGRGDTGISIADDEDAIFYNPAGIAYGKGIYKKTILASPTVELSRDTKNFGRELGVEESSPVETFRKHVGKPQHLGLYNFSGIILRRAALGAFASATSNVLISKSKDYGALEMVNASASENMGLTFSIAESFLFKDTYWGLTGKYMQRGQAEIEVNAAESDKVTNLKEGDLYGYGYGTGGDFGLMYRKGDGRIRPSLGLTVMNMGNTKIVPEKKTTVLDPVYQTINIGSGIEVGTQYSKFKLLCDYVDLGGKVEENAFKKIHIGSELSIEDFFGFTSGINQGYPSGGVYVDMRLLRMDFGTYTEELGDRAGSRPDQRYFFRLMAGF